MDKAGKFYWDRAWEKSPLPTRIDPRTRGIRHYTTRQFHLYFERLFSTSSNRKRLLEIGCAQSAWLPYFATEFGFEITGLDYSELGCCKARQVLANEGVSGEVVHCDFFAPPTNLLRKYDFVFSLGVAEHFEDTGACIRAFSEFLKPGGYLITVIPNMRGTIGFLQKCINRSVYDVHVPLRRGDLQRAYETAGLIVTDCRYFLCTGFNVVNIGVQGIHTTDHIKRVILLGMRSISKLFWFFDENVCTLPTLSALSPFIVCVGQWRNDS